MSALDIDWGAAPKATDPVTASYTGAGMGYELGQKGATIHALQGIDLNDPKSIDAGIGNLVHANALEQGNALQNLSFTRSLRSQIPGLLDSLSGKSESSQPASDVQQSADPNHAIETFSMARDAADKLAATPEADRPAAFAQIKQDLLKRGVPEEAIDSAGQHLAGNGPQELSQYYAGLIAHASHQMNPQAGAEPPAMPGAHPSSAWYDNVVANPKVPLAVAMMKGAGLDLSAYLDTAKSLAMPGIQKAADLASAGPIAQATATANKGVEIAGAPTLAVIEAWKAGEIADAQVGPALRKAQGEADIAARHGLSLVPVNDAQGNPTGRTQQLRTDQALQHPGGVSQSPADQASDVVDRTAFANNYKEDVNQPSITADKNSRDQSLVAARMAQSPEINPSNLTDWAARNASFLSAFGIDKKQANNLSTYQTLVAQNLKSAIQVYPKNMGEFHAIQNAVADAKSPGDAAALALTENAAIHDAAVHYKEFRRDWAAQNPNNTSEKAFQAAWAHQPAANQSMFASPAFRDLKFNGQPAVVIVPTSPSDNGRVYGIFMPHTPQATKFRVR